ACQKGSARPEELSGGSFTVTNLGALGIESFTPVLNIPEVAILGVCSIQPKAVMKGETAVFKPHMGLSLTINHQAVDGAPGARFLQELVQAVSRIDMLLAG
ncbi:MAG: 2-oxo acid dehydrogenase subunit E2, partial [Spirochaetales bacterium]